MSLFKFKGIDVPMNIIADSYWKQTVYYLLDHRYRKATNLVQWLDDIVAVARQNTAIVKALEEIPDRSNHDQQALACLKWVVDNITYEGDKLVWDTNEYWQTPYETLELMTGDCEDGAILLYTLCKLKGVPANRLMLFAGDVVGGGHCWLGYRPLEYPLNWAFLDWCYWHDHRTMNYRNLYYVKGTSIRGYQHSDEGITGTDSRYQTVWFGFNEERSHKSFDYSHVRREV